MGDDKLALMAFDAGLMQDFGVAYAVAPFADLYLASQDVQSQFGFNWNALWPALSKPTQYTIAQIRKTLVDSYKITDSFVNFVAALRCDLASNANKAAVGIGRARSQ